jgi:hypothetical protein
VLGKALRRCESFSSGTGWTLADAFTQLIPHADVIFLNKHYARAHSPHYAASPRAFLLSLTTIAPPHALLVAHWGSDGAAVLSVPTREYFQSSGWVDTSVPAPVPSMPSTSAPTISVSVSAQHGPVQGEVQSVRSGSDFWARGHHTESSSEFTAALLSSTSDPSSPIPPRRRRAARRADVPDSDSDASSDSAGTETGRPAAHATGVTSPPQIAGVVDEIGAQDAFVAGMMFALSRRLVPGEPYTPSAVAREGASVAVRGAEPDRDKDRGRWRLEECLRYVFSATAAWKPHGSHLRVGLRRNWRDGRHGERVGTAWQKRWRKRGGSNHELYLWIVGFVRNCSSCRASTLHGCVITKAAVLCETLASRLNHILSLSVYPCRRLHSSSWEYDNLS